MRKETSEWTIRMLHDIKDRINVETEYQRGLVWTRPQKALLIDSIMRQFDIPKIYLRKNADGAEFLFDVVDGKQRLNAIWGFLTDEFPLPRTTDIEDIPGLENIGGLKWSKLTNQAQDRLQFATITITKIEPNNENDVHELFLRLQRGETLNPAEKRHAMRGKLRDFVEHELANHVVWEKMGFRESRYGYSELSAIALALVYENGAAGIKSVDLEALYAKDGFDPEGKEAKRVRTLLNTLDHIAGVEPGFIKTRWGYVDLLLCIIRLKNKKHDVAPDSMMTFFKEFEDERQHTAKKIDEVRERVLETLSDEDIVNVGVAEDISSDMMQYHLAFSREGANKRNIETRVDIMFNKLQDFMNRQGS